MWGLWCQVAVEHRDAAKVARIELEHNWDMPHWHLSARREQLAATTSIAAAAFALEGWAFSCAPGSHAPDVTLGAAGVLAAVNRHFVVDRTARKLLEHRLLAVFKLRGDAVHHKAAFGSGLRAHPVLGRLGNTSRESATYTAEAAKRSCDTLKRVVQLALDSPPTAVPAHIGVRHVALEVVSTISF